MTPDEKKYRATWVRRKREYLNLLKKDEHYLTKYAMWYSTKPDERLKGMLLSTVDRMTNTKNKLQLINQRIGELP
jgi:hypothetical protein